MRIRCTKRARLGGRRAEAVLHLAREIARRRLRPIGAGEALVEREAHADVGDVVLGQERRRRRTRARGRPRGRPARRAARAPPRRASGRRGRSRRAATVPLCSAPRRSPAPRSSRSSDAIWKPRAELGVPLERLDARARLVGHRVRRRHDRGSSSARSLRAADAAAELVELREAEDVGAVDDDRVGARDVEPALDDCRGAEDVVAPLDEVEHRLLERAPRAICPCADARCAPSGTSSARRARAARRGPRRGCRRRRPARRARARGRRPRVSTLSSHARHDGADGAPIDGRRRDERHVAQPAHRHLQRARDRRRREREHVDVGA